MNKTWKQIEASRNRRLWVTSVLIPVASMTVMVGTSLYNNNLQFRYEVNGFMNNPKNWIKSKFKKK